MDYTALNGAGCRDRLGQGYERPRVDVCGVDLLYVGPLFSVHVSGMGGMGDLALRNKRGIHFSSRWSVVVLLIVLWLFVGYALILCDVRLCDACGIIFDVRGIS